MKTKTLKNIRDSVITEGQYERSQDLNPPGDPSLLNDYVNKALIRGRELVSQTWQDYYTISTTFTTASGVSSYALPSDFAKFRLLEATINGKQVRLYPHDLMDAHRYSSSLAASGEYRYRLQAGSIVFVPAVATATPMTLYYEPHCPELVNDTDTVAILVDAEFELYVLLALAKCRKREDLDTSQLEADIAECVKRLVNAADSRDESEPFYLGDERGGAWTAYPFSGMGWW